MNIKDLILYELPQLSLEDSGQKALMLMRDFNIYHLPVVHKDEYIALISEDDILDWDSPEENLGSAEFLKFRPAVFDHHHPIEAIKIAKEFKLSVIPVMDEEKNFLGCITRENLFNFITDTNTFNQEGGVIILRLKQIDYSLSEITRLAESNKVTIQGVLVRSDQEEGSLRITLKTNRADLQALISTYERYDYIVEDVYNALQGKEDIQQNYDLLMHYLNI